MPKLTLGLRLDEIHIVHASHKAELVCGEEISCRDYLVCDVENPYSGSPLEALDEWTLVGNDTPHQNSRVGWYDFGKSIVFPVWVNDLGAMNLSAFKGHTARLSGYLDAYPPIDKVTWCMPFAKMIDTSNMVGARQNGQNIEINTRVNGTWNTIGSVANFDTGFWIVEITDVRIKVFINGVLKIEKDHTISGEADFGISSHKVEAEFKIRDYGVSENPHWWYTPTLDESDIIGAWDFGWAEHLDEELARTDFINGLVFTTRAGSPTIRHNDGYIFGGGGAAHVQLGELDWSEVSFVMEFQNWLENGTLDAAFSHFNDDARVVLQQDLNAGQLKVRWSCGDGTATTYEFNETRTNGVYGGSGTKLYRDGTLLGEVPATGPAIATQKFVLGALEVENNGSQTQFSKIWVSRLLLVKRKLTDNEQADIYLNMQDALGLIDDTGNFLVDDNGDILVEEAN